MRTSKANHETTFILIEWLDDDGTKLVAYFDDEDGATKAYDVAGIPSKLFRVWKECK